ncbi:hypothetical protein [Paracoccus sp. 1_MG-2023]|uniref:hypothetical protein n=1 Tax=unclassified Paracoccus (in: a-proteobacteria) TaxID=2688777 RepID=UPI0034C6B14E
MLVGSGSETTCRAGSCTLRPGVEVTAKSTTRVGWSVDGVSLNDQDRLVCGGTPVDFAAVQAI